MLGKLSWAAIPLDQPIPLVTAGLVGFGLACVLLLVAVKGWVPYLWREWITSVDHKRIGVMYCLLALVMLLRGFSDALLMRSQQALAYHAPGYLPPDHYDQIFSAHGTMMIFFVAMPFVVGLMNFAVPLQLGIRDVAFPTLNNVSFWLTATGALLVNISLLVGEFAKTGWLPYPPLSELAYSPGVGVDYYLWSLQIAGVGTLMSGINLVTTILKIHAPGMTYLRMPMFCWTALASNLLIVAAFPVLTATLGMLLLDRYLGFHFFTNQAGGNVMMFMNLIWAWGHPEVYILILPNFGIFSEVVSTFSRKPLFGYRSMVAATMVICVLAFSVWLHHFFTMGAGGDVNAIFGILSMVIAVPTGVKVFNWLFTMYGGRVTFAQPMLWAIGFMVTFVIGGMTGVLLAVPPADFVLHNSLFLVAHFHNVIIGGVLFGLFAGYTYWFPKAFGFRLHEGLGRAAFWCWLVGFYVAFGPLYVLGLMGMTRRMQHYDVAAWRPWLLVAGVGALTILAGIVLQAVQLVVSIRRRESLRDLTGDPWDGRSLEWATASPPPAFNFAVLPNVEGEDAYWGIKQAHRDGIHEEDPEYAPIEMPRNSSTGVVCAFFATLVGFALIWHIWWLAIAGLVGAFATFVVFAWRDRAEDVISVEEVARIDGAHRQALRAAGAPRRVGGLLTLLAAALAAIASITALRSGQNALAFQVHGPAGRPAGPASRRDPNHLGHKGDGRARNTEHGERGPASKRIIVGYGFWVFLLSDIIMFGAFFAAYAVLYDRTAGGPAGHDLFDTGQVAIETGCLLLSSFTCGLASIGVQQRRAAWFYGAMAATFMLGTAFIGLELTEFVGLIAHGNGPDRSAFLSAFFALVGLHGVHVSVGLLWLLTMMAQVWAKGFRPDILRRVLCFSLFWHALDIVWVGVFTVVYLVGVAT